ncbi:YbaY family lipoprotein [Mangrovicoccus sp. HB161399]|uniref:YbaY family lipoprotein n=1 Tax=Mangrovicoccus sp. HB161399 TaxID=2720392 RepID=UPI0015516685|nr:YbaY family lipoprotein [Mangrovicoccus sp. HB161399]
MTDTRIPIRRLGGALALFLLAAVQTMAEPATLTGTVTYLERIVLPPDATVEVKLQDVSRADAPALTIAETSFAPETQVPVAFALGYDSSAIDERHRYALRARILAGDRVLFLTKRHFGVLTGGEDSTDILVERAAAQPASPAGLWLAEEIGGDGVIDQLRTVLEIAADGTVSGSGGCNSISGQATVSGSGIAFGPVAATRKLCPPAIMDQEEKFLRALGLAASWRIDPELHQLILMDGTGQPIAVLSRL